MPFWLICGALLGTHLKMQGLGFRQKDAKFIIELLATWRWSADERQTFPPFHNTQVAREMANLVGLGWLKPVGRGRPPKYKVTRAGLVGLMEEMRRSALNGDYSTFAFLRYLLDAYRDRLLKYIEEGEAGLPLPQRLDVERILDTRALVKERRQRIQARVTYWKKRIEEVHGVVELVDERSKSNVPLPQIVSEIERRYPYELAYSKPLTTLLAELPEELKVWEITEGNRRRADAIWQTYVSALELELQQLK